MKKLIVIVALFFVLAWVWTKKPVIKAVPIDLAGQVVEDFPAELQALNQQLAAIQSIEYRNITITSNQVGVPIYASLAYKKDNFLRLIGFALKTKEIDIGSNEKHFWFWLRRSKPPVLYYADHSRRNSVGLKPIFNPDWIEQTISINPIKVDDAVILRDGPQIKIYNQDGNLVRMTKIQGDRIIGHYLYESTGKLIISAEILDYYDVDGIMLARKIHVLCPEENMISTWELSYPILNGPLADNLWQMPLEKSVELP